MRFLKIALWTIGTVCILLLIFVTTISAFSAIQQRQITQEELREDGGNEIQLLETIRKLAQEAGHPNASLIGVNREADVCYSKTCLESSIEILEAINFGADPCDPEGFGAFACHRRIHRDPSDSYQSQFGNISLPAWLTFNKNVRLSDEILEAPISDNDSRALVNAKITYNQCKEVDTLVKTATKLLWELSESYGGWPALTQKEPKGFDWIKFAAFFAKLQTTSLLFEVSSTLTKDGFELSLDKGNIFSNQDFETISDSYTKLLESIRKSWKDFEAGFDLPESFDSAIQNTMNSRQTLALYINMFATQRIKTPMTIAELNNFTYSIDWLEFFKTSFESSHFEINLGTIVNVNKPYIKILVAAMDEAGIWEASLLQFELFTLLRKATTISKRKTDCSEGTKKVFGAILSKEFLKKYPYTDPKKRDIELMMDNVLISLKEDINSSKVLNDNTKLKLVEKFDNVEKFLGYPDWLDNDVRVQYYYEKLQLVNLDSEYLNNLIKIVAWNEGVHREGLVPEIDNLHYWPLNTFIVEASGANYLKPSNALRVPAPFSSPPIYSYGAPGFMNYGGLATVLAHELGHGMDTTGILYNKDGNYKKSGWWDDESMKIYNDWVKGIMRDFNDTKLHYHGPKTDLKTENLNSKATINDDIADLIGLYVAFNAYKKYVDGLPGQVDKKLPGLEHIEGEKLFYVKYSNMWCEELTKEEAENAWASNHSPGYNRATVPLKRSKHFAKTFDCKNKLHRHQYEL